MTEITTWRVQKIEAMRGAQARNRKAYAAYDERFRAKRNKAVRDFLHTP